MKYIVTIGSHTQFLSSIGILDTLGVKDAANVLVLYVRKYKNTLLALPYREMEIFDLYNISLDSITNRRNRRKLISSLDQIVSDFVGEDVFMAIIPHVATPVFQILATNSACVGLKFAQEGAIPFKNRFVVQHSWKSLVYSVYNKIVLSNHRCWRTDLWLVPPFLRKKVQVETYDLADFFKYMPNVDKHHIIKWPQIEINYTIDSSFPCFIFDSFMEMKCVEVKEYIGCAKEMVNKYGKTSNYIKFHPAQTTEHRDMIKEIFQEQGKKIIELPMNIPFECFIIKYPQLIVVGFFSSLLDFANQINNHKVIELHNELASCSKGFEKWYLVNVQ